MKKQPKSAGRQKAEILAIFYDFLGPDGDVVELADYLQHCGIERITAGTDLVETICNHYRTGSRAYDLKRACQDLASWPPIVARVAELRAERSKRL